MRRRTFPHEPWKASTSELIFKCVTNVSWSEFQHKLPDHHFIAGHLFLFSSKRLSFRTKPIPSDRKPGPIFLSLQRRKNRAMKLGESYLARIPRPRTKKYCDLVLPTDYEYLDTHNGLPLLIRIELERKEVQQWTSDCPEADVWESLKP